jgi:hypothetical protein
VLNLEIPITDLGTSLTLSLPFTYKFGGTASSAGRWVSRTGSLYIYKKDIQG